jgi:hypothetical protein
LYSLTLIMPNIRSRQGAGQGKGYQYWSLRHCMIPIACCVYYPAPIAFYIPETMGGKEGLTLYYNGN